jgi:hypothetical protein
MFAAAFIARRVGGAPAAALVVGCSKEIAHMLPLKRRHGREKGTARRKHPPCDVRAKDAIAECEAHRERRVAHVHRKS